MVLALISGDFFSTELVLSTGFLLALIFAAPASPLPSVHSEVCTVSQCIDILCCIMINIQTYLASLPAALRCPLKQQYLTKGLFLLLLQETR